MRIAICEDDPLHAQLLVKMIAHWQKTEEGQKETVKTEIFLSAEQLLCSKEESFSFDLAFLDIGLKQMDGLELARHLRAENEQIILVFTTFQNSFLEQIRTKPYRTYIVMDTCSYIYRASVSAFLLKLSVDSLCCMLVLSVIYIRIPVQVKRELSPETQRSI